jgi:hypothetical protein
MVKLNQARLMDVLRQRYQEGSTTDKSRTFDGLVALTPTTPSTRFAYSVRALHYRVYDDAVRKALGVLGKRALAARMTLCGISRALLVQMKGLASTLWGATPTRARW